MTRPNALLVGFELSNWMAKKGYNLSDVHRGLVILNPATGAKPGNGNGRGEGRSRVLVALRKPTPHRSGNIGLESC